LRERLETPADLRDFPAFADNHRKHLQRSDEPVAGGAVIGQHHMAGRLAADIHALCAHFLDHIAIADLGAFKRKALAGEKFLQAKIGHHCGYDAAAFQRVALFPGPRDQRQNLVAIDDAPFFVANNHAVCIAIEGNADIGAIFQHSSLQVLRRGGADIVVDVETIRFNADGFHFRTKLPQNRRRDFVTGAVGAIDNDAHALEGKTARKGRFCKFDIARARIINALDPAEVGRGCKPGVGAFLHQPFDFAFGFVREFEPVRAEKLHAIIVKRIMRGGNHHAEIGA